MIRLALLLLFLAEPLLSQQSFASRCASCHGEDARGTAKAPGLAMNPRVSEQSTEQLRDYLQRGNAGAGMPSFADVPADELASLVRYLRRINADAILVPMAEPGSAPKIAWGPPQPGDWLTYNGNDSGNRYSPLDQIRASNVSSLKLKWVFPISYFGLETTPLAASDAGSARPTSAHPPDGCTLDGPISLMMVHHPPFGESPGASLRTGFSPGTPGPPIQRAASRGRCTRAPASLAR